MGKLDYFIDIGLHNTTDEHLVQTVDGNVYMTDRDWVTLKFKLYDKNSIGQWSCIDGFSNYNATPRYDLQDHYPNKMDSSQNCQVSTGYTQSIVGGLINATVEFNRMFDTGDALEDIRLEPGMQLAVQTRLTDELSPRNHRYESWSDFYWTIPFITPQNNAHGLEHAHSQTEVNLIIAALLIGSWGIIFTCRYLDNKKATEAKAKAMAAQASAAPKFKL